MRKALIAANWKCHGSLAMVDEYAAVLEHSAKVETVVFPPAVFVARFMQWLLPGGLTVVCRTLV